MIYTSYYRITPATVPGALCISRYAPRYSKYKHYRPLAPGPWFKSVSIDHYLMLYGEQLLALDPHQVVDELHTLTAGADPILLCYETPSKFCHRRLVAQWLEQSLNIQVPEVRIEPEGTVTQVPGWEVIKQSQNLAPF